MRERFFFSSTEMEIKVVVYFFYRTGRIKAACEVVKNFSLVFSRQMWIII